MPRAAFSHIRTWVFDLDNTLYPPEARLFAQIEVKMTEWVAQNLAVSRTEADRLRARYWSEHGTTLAGLMREHGVEPTAYLAEVHDIDFSALMPDPDLTAAILALPGRRIVHTNADTPYAARVLAARGLDGVFDAVYGVEHSEFRPKPEREAFDVVIALDGYSPETAAMFEDDPRNLAVPHALGMRTVHVAPRPEPQPHIHYHTADLAGFLRELV